MLKRGGTTSPAAVVALLRWPQDSARRAALAASGAPRLLLVEPPHQPPPDLAADEDWIRMPAAEGDVHARASELGRRYLSRRASPPMLEDRVLKRNGASVVLSAAEAELVAELVASFDHMVLRDRLRAVGGGSDRSLDSHVYRLRKELAPLDLDIIAVRGRGFVLTQRMPSQ